jgi:hypothetical protein
MHPSGLKASSPFRYTSTNKHCKIVTWHLPPFMVNGLPFSTTGYPEINFSRVVLLRASEILHMKGQ